MTTPMPVAWSDVSRAYARHILPTFVPAAEALCTFAGITGGENVLDVACGPGTASMIARKHGAAQVTGVDYAAGMIAVARERTAGLDGYTFVEGNALDLPVPDAAFDVAISSFGVIFAPDPPRAVSELARALRPNGHVALLAWLQNGSTQEYYEQVYRHIRRHPAPHDPYEWGIAERAAGWLSAAFTGVETHPLDVPFHAPSVEAIWTMLSTSTGRVAAEYRTLDPTPRATFDAAMHHYFARFRTPDGAVCWPREALLYRGRKPVPRAGAPGEIFI